MNVTYAVVIFRKRVKQQSSVDRLLTVVCFPARYKQVMLMTVSEINKREFLVSQDKHTIHPKFRFQTHPLTKTKLAVLSRSKAMR